jgi:glycosyltransferase involved in cell wall biosynthesis
MKILLSAYACDAKSGSESGIGWNFAKELANQGNKVTILTKNPAKDKAFTEEIQRLGMQNKISVLYYDLPKWLQSIYKSGGRSEQLFYIFWQIGIYFYVKKLLKKQEFDLIHHITIGVFRTPSFLYSLGKPFIFGPVGGGEEFPKVLMENFLPKYRLLENLRSFANSTAKFNPWLNQCFKKSQLILLKTSDNLNFIPKEFHHKCKVSLEVGIAQIPDFENTRHNKTIKILYAGRLAYFKGIHLAIKAFAKAVAIHPNIEFTIVGSGNDEKWLKDIARQQQVYDKITWVPFVARNVLFEMYKEYDLLLFPSLHDSSGGVVLEALSFGLPVVCLDLGGPKEIIDSKCGYIISTKNLTEDEVAIKLSEALNQLISNPALLAQMQVQARTKASTFTWDKVIQKIYTYVQESMEKKNRLVEAKV